MAGSELSVLARQCLDRRIPGRPLCSKRVAAWESEEISSLTVDRATTSDARIKFKRYPSIADRLRSSKPTGSKRASRPEFSPLKLRCPLN